MKPILILVTGLLFCIQLIDSRKIRVIPDDEIYPYTIQKEVTQYSEYISLEHILFEQIDDDVVRGGGYADCIKSMDPKLSIQLDVRTQLLHQSSWIEGPLRLIVPGFCAEVINPTRFWYNITKLWTNCPPAKGERLMIETQTIDVKFDIPPSMLLGKWRFYCLLSQGLLSPSHQFGWMFQVELVEVV